MNNRVVITGMGAISPLGLDVPTLWKNLIAGKSGISRITRFDPSALKTQIAAEVKGFDSTEYVGYKEARRMDRYTQFAVAASMQAVQEAKLAIDESNANEVGVIISAGLGGAETLCKGFSIFLEKGPSKITPLLFPMMLNNMASAQVAVAFGVRGPNFCISSACASSSHAIGEAAEIIKRGDAQVMIAGGSGAGIVPLSIAAFNAMRAISTWNDEPTKASRPFDAERDGFVLGEGAAVVILENLTYAQERGAEICAELVGYAATADALHMTAPDPEGLGAALAIERALHKASIKPSEVNYINAHGTSTILNDAQETRAIKIAFGEYAYEVPISSTKSMTGHLMAAAGALEAIVCILTIREGLIHPTINYETPDPECDLDYVPNIAREAPIEVALSNSFGFGGHNAVLVFRKCRE